MFLCWSLPVPPVEPKPKFRSRSGCQTCRRRRVKCDEKKPICDRCHRSKNSCSYELRLQWPDRGHSNNSSNKRNNSGKNSEIAYLDRYQPWQEPQKALVSSLTSFSTSSSSCLSFYESVLCAMAVTVDDERHNPLRNTVMPRVFTNRLAYHAVLMASAHYLSSVDERFRLVEMQSRQRLLAGTRRALMNHAVEDVLVPTVFLCSSAISSSTDSSWLQHLTCFQYLVQHGLPAPPMVMSYFSAHLVLAKSLFAIEPIFPDPSWTSSEALRRVMPDMLGEIDVWNGLSHGLLLLINDILDLKNSEDKQGRVHGLEHRLETCVQVLPLSLQRHTRASLLESTAEAYRLAAWILLQESCREEFLGIALEKLERRREEEEEAILQLVEQVIGGLDYLPISWPLWPLFIASCVCVDEETQRRAFALFSLAAQKAPFENILRAQTVAQLVWQRRPRASLGVFPWQVVLQFLGWETSFA